jgi:hypothetical protein
MEPIPWGALFDFDVELRGIISTPFGRIARYTLSIA